MRTTDLHASSSIAAMTAAFPRGPRIAFAPDDDGRMVMWQGKMTPAKDIVRNDAVPGAKPTARKDAARKDDAEGAPPATDPMDKLMATLKTIGDGQAAISARLDALEGKGKEASPKGADDLTEEEREEIAKNDGAGPSMIEREIGAIKGRMSYAERQRAETAKEDALAKIQVRADAAANLHGRRAPAPMTGETLDAYKVRCLREHQKFSEAFKGVDLGVIARAEPAAFAAIEDRIYADSAKAAKRPAGPADGGLMLRERFDKDMQRNVKEYFGRNTYAKLLSPEAQRFVGFKVQPRAA